MFFTHLKLPLLQYFNFFLQFKVYFRRFLLQFFAVINDLYGEIMETLQYKDFGVDIDEGNDFVQALKPLVKETFNPLVLGGLGGFSGCFALPTNYKKPILCAATDGVGSKLSLALAHNRLDNIGIDLVAMCVNDLICDFATPLFFLDYYATHKLVSADALRIVRGIAEGCKMAQCALIGGETAEMPSVYAKGDFDLAGFAVGMAEQDDIQRRATISEGDVILGLASSGFHSNGFSLVRGIIDTKNINVRDEILGKPLIDLILTPTRIYVKEFLEHKDKIKGLAHITGGGLKENLIRILPDNTQAIIDENSIRTPELFQVFLPYIAKEEAWRVFNMGVGMVLVVPKEHAKELAESMQAMVIGHIQTGQKEVILK